MSEVDEVLGTRVERGVKRRVVVFVALFPGAR